MVLWSQVSQTFPLALKPTLSVKLAKTMVKLLSSEQISSIQHSSDELLRLPWWLLEFRLISSTTKLNGLVRCCSREDFLSEQYIKGSGDKDEIIRWK